MTLKLKSYIDTYLIPESQRNELSVENKYIIERKDIQNFHANLKSKLKKDPVYSYSKVYTIYFDNHKLANVTDHHISSYHKAKYRLRYYNKGNESGFYLESKVKFGHRRLKERTKLDITIADYQSIKKGKLKPKDLHPSLSNLVPILEMTYDRDRYLEKNDRLSLDRNINVIWINTDILPKSKLPITFPFSIFEVKVKSEYSTNVEKIIPAYISNVSVSKYVYAYELIKSGNRTSKWNHF